MHEVNTARQPWLPDLDQIKPTIIKNYPQPRIKKFKNIKRYEIIHRPFDLRFRGFINRWLKSISDKDNLDLKKILGEDFNLIDLYFKPQGKNKRWITQKDLLKKTKLKYLYKVRPKLVDLLLKTWEKAKTK